MISNEQTLAIGKKVLSDESQALLEAAERLTTEFCRAVEALLLCKGKVITTGLGKSGRVANKVSSTLSSLGTPSFFLDASDASHGDLGQITSNDIVILISNSGKSQELKNIIQYSSRNKYIKLIGVTAN